MTDEILTYPSLYKRSTTGKDLVWYQERWGHRHRAVSGQVDGVKTVSNWTVCETKNPGRANEIKPEMQAHLEIESNYKKKLQSAYQSEEDFRNNPDLRNNVFMPMLADKFKPATYLTEMIWLQPKLDGVRCIARADGLWSRNGKPILSAPHIHEALRPVFKARPHIILDGELYNHELKDDFNQIVSLVRKAKPTKEDLEASAKLVQYHLYDVDGEDDYAKRLGHLDEIMVTHNILDPIYRLRTMHHVDRAGKASKDRQEEIENRANEFIEAGYEGLMIRLDGFGYQCKRSPALLKYKGFEDAEFTVIGIEEGVGNRSGMAGKVLLDLPKQKTTFRASIRGTHDFCRKLLTERHNYIGGEATVRYQNLTPDGIPRFGVVVAFHPDGRDT